MVSKRILPKFHNREEHLIKIWETGPAKRKSDDTPNMLVNKIQFNFETKEREQAFLDAQYPTPEKRQLYDQYRYEWHRRPHEFNAENAPLSVNCELVSTCNLACTMCYTVTEEFQNSIIGSQRMMPWPQVRSIIDEAAELGVPSMSFSWRGESTLYKFNQDGQTIRFADVLKYAREKGILEITSLTHGQHIDQNMAEAIVDAAPNWISISMDGIYEEYNSIRTPRNKNIQTYDAFHHLVKNIKRLVKIRNDRGQKLPQLRSNSIYPAISKDPKGYRDFLISIGIDQITVNELLDLRNGVVPEEMIMPNWSCQYPFQRLTVSANGIILPCTGAHKEQSSLVLGRIKGSPEKNIHDAKGNSVNIPIPELNLKEAWNCKKLERIRYLHKSGRREEIDPGCRHCNHGVKKFGPKRMPDEWDTKEMAWTSTQRKG